MTLAQFEQSLNHPKALSISATVNNTKIDNTNTNSLNCFFNRFMDIIIQEGEFDGIIIERGQFDNFQIPNLPVSEDS